MRATVTLASSRSSELLAVVDGTVRERVLPQYNAKTERLQEVKADQLNTIDFDLTLR